MKKLHSLLMLGAVVSMSPAYAELYKSIGPDGKVTYSDMPPPSAARIEKKSIGAANTLTANLPYELAQAAGKHPVTLYTAAQCSPCEEGRQLLSKRGIPFQEKTVNTTADAAKVKQATGADGGLPVLTVGRNTHVGFEAAAWNGALTSAGYPDQNRLPSNYRNPAAEAAAPVVKPPVEAQATTAERQAPVLPKAATPASSAPAGFRF